MEEPSAVLVETIIYQFEAETLVDLLNNNILELQRDSVSSPR